MARTGLRMMPTFPLPPLKFRTVGFPQYGFKAGISKGTFLTGIRIKPTPGILQTEASLSPFFACSLQQRKLGSVPRQIRRRACRHSRGGASLPQGSSAPVRVLLSHTISTYTTPCASPSGTLRFRSYPYTQRLRCAGVPRRPAGPSRLSLLYFPHVPSTISRWAAVPSRCTHTAIPGFLDIAASRPHNPRLYQQYPTAEQFRDCIVRFMLRPACLPSPPDWLRRDEVTCAPPRLLRYIVIRAFRANRYRLALRIRLNG